MKRHELTKENLEKLLCEYEEKLSLLEDASLYVGSGGCWKHCHMEVVKRVFNPRNDNPFINLLINEKCTHGDGEICSCDHVTEDTMEDIHFINANTPDRLRYDEHSIHDKKIVDQLTSNYDEFKGLPLYDKLDDPFRLRGYYGRDCMIFSPYKYIVNLNSIPILEDNIKMVNATLKMERSHRNCMSLIRCLKFLNSIWGLSNGSDRIIYYDVPNEIIFKIFSFCYF